MIGRLLGKLISWFEPSLQSDLESWLISQNPKSSADLERLIKEYTYKNLGISL